MKKAKKWNILFFIAGVLILAYMIYAIGLDTIWDNIKKTGWWFLPITGLWLVVYLINTAAYTSIVHDKRMPKAQWPSFFRMLKITISGYAINYITPVVALGGEPHRILELQGALGSRRATSVTLSYSMMHILSHFVFWMCSTILIIVILKPAWTMIVGCAVLFAVFTFALLLLFKGYRQGLIVKTFRILGKIPFMRKPVQRFNEKKQAAFQEIDSHIVAFYTERKPTFFLALSLELLARVVSCFELLFIAKAIGLDLGVVDAIVLYAGSTLFANLLFFSPMQLGTREGGLMLTLSMMGFHGVDGVYIGLVMRVRELCWITIGLLLMHVLKNKE